MKEGDHDAKVGSAKGIPNDNDPRRVGIGFKIEGQADEVFKEYPNSFDEGSPLRQDVETILGTQLTSKQATAGFESSKIIGKSCRVVAMHKAGAGGKPKAVVSVVRASDSED